MHRRIVPLAGAVEPLFMQQMNTSISRRALDQQSQRELLSLLASWSLPALLGLGIGVTLAIKWPLHDFVSDVALRAALCATVGFVVFLGFAPWSHLRRQLQQRMLVRELVTQLERVRNGRERDNFNTLLHMTDNEFGRLGRAIHDALLEVAQARRETQMLHRTMDDRIRKETSRASAWLMRQAQTDPLTGLGNRRSLEAWVDALLQQHPNPIALVGIVIDIDFFKDVNDTLGHDAGDDCLRHLGRLVRSNVQQPGHSIRLGGDEFVALLPDTSVQEGEALARRLVAFFGQMPWSHENVTRPTLSIGLAQGEIASHDDVHAMLRQADEALYRSKRTGRATFSVHQSAGSADGAAATEDAGAA